MSTLDRNRLNQAVTKSLDWIQRNQEQFSLSHAKDAEEQLQLLKPLGELALALDTIDRLHPKRFPVTDLVHWCWKELREGEILIDTLSVRPDLIVSATLYACFLRAGLENANLCKLISFLHKSPSARGIELPTWRRLDVEHGFEALGLSEFPKDADKSTWFGSLPEPWTMTDDIAYSLTHNVFYITDFGFKANRLSDSAKDYIRTWLRSWLYIYFRQGNWDIFSELLMVSGCIHVSDAFSQQFDQLLAAQSSDGMTSGPKHSAKNLLKTWHGAARANFLRNYHTSLVALMACAFGLRSGAPAHERSTSGAIVFDEDASN